MVFLGGNEIVSPLVTQLSRTMSPMMVSQYQLQLPDKEILRKKLQELSNIPKIED